MILDPSGDRLIAVDYQSHIAIVDCTSPLALVEDSYVAIAGTPNLQQAAFDWDRGYAFVADIGNFEIHVLDISTNTISLVTSFSDATNIPFLSAGIAYDSANQRLFVSDYNDDSLVWYDASDPSALVFEDSHVDASYLTVVMQMQFDLTNNVLLTQDNGFSEWSCAWDVYGVY